MSVTGAKYPTYGMSSSDGNWYDDDWVNPTYIYGDDSTGATVTAVTYDAGDQTCVLKASGFDFSSVPLSCQILGVTCVINAWSTTADKGAIDLVQLLSSAGARGGTNLGSTATLVSTDMNATYTFGSSTNTWGNSLTATWVKSTSFGVAMGMMAGGAGNNNVDVAIDCVTLNVAYQEESVQHRQSGKIIRRGRPYNFNLMQD